MTDEQYVKSINEKLDKLEEQEKGFMESITKILEANAVSLAAIARYLDKAGLSKLQIRELEHIFLFTETFIIMSDKHDNSLYRVDYSPKILFQKRDYLTLGKRVEYLEIMNKRLPNVISNILMEIYYDLC